jgi:hypothetical protein
MGVDLAEMMEANKRLALDAGWAVQNEELTFVVPLEIEGATIPLNLRGKTYLRQPDRNVMLQVEFVPDIGKTEPLSRFDWKPFHTHNNRNRGPAKWRFIPLNQTHVHAFNLNWLADDKKMIGKNLPVATPLEADPSFTEMLAILKQKFKILNASEIPPPPWERRLI